MLRKPGGLERLELSSCAFRSQERSGTPAGPSLVKLVEFGKLLHLNISGAYGDPATATGIFRSIASAGSKLRSLSMRESDIGIFSIIPPMVPGPGKRAPTVPSEEAIAAVIDAIGRSKCLQELDLGNCSPLGTNEMAAKIAQSLKNSSLRKLSLKGLIQVTAGRPDAPIVVRPGIGKDGIEALLNAADAAPQLQEIELTLMSRHGLPNETVDKLKAHKKFACGF